MIALPFHHASHRRGDAVHRTTFLLILLFLLSTALHGMGFPGTGDQTTSRAIARLGDPDPAIRWDAITDLAKTGERAVPELAGALRNDNATVRWSAAIALRRMGSTARGAAPELGIALADSSARVREEAAAALGAIGARDVRTVAALIPCLSDRDVFVVGKAAGALGTIGEPAVPALIRTLGASDRSARRAAAIALAKMGAAAMPAVRALTSSLADASEDVRYTAAHALAGIGPDARASVPALLHTLSDADQDVRAAATEALRRIAPDAVEFHGRWGEVAAIIDTLTPLLMRETHVPGVAVAIIRDRRIVWTGHYGVTNVGTGTPVTDSTMFEACSMSKPVLACLAMRLTERGLLDLDRPLAGTVRLPSLEGQPGADAITARMVLSHTSGLPNWRKGDDEFDGPLPVMFPPGSRFGYSGEAIYYVQQVVEAITNAPLDVYARRDLFGPAGFTHMDFTWSARTSAFIAAGHDAEGKLIGTTRYDHANAAYTLYTSAADYARFLIGLMSSQESGCGSLTPASASAMFSHQVSVPAREPIERPGRAKATTVYWGLGWGINVTAQGDIIHHSGANRSGFRCFSQFNPSTGTGMVIMTNGINGSDLWTRIIARVGNF